MRRAGSQRTTGTSCIASATSPWDKTEGCRKTMVVEEVSLADRAANNDGSSS